MARRDVLARLEALEGAGASRSTIEEALDAAEALVRATERGASAETLAKLEARCADVEARLSPSFAEAVRIARADADRLVSAALRERPPEPMSAQAAPLATPAPITHCAPMRTSRLLSGSRPL